jgi:hypothetical protein
LGERFIDEVYVASPRKLDMGSPPASLLTRFFPQEIPVCCIFTVIRADEIILAVVQMRAGRAIM